MSAPVQTRPNGDGARDLRVVLGSRVILDQVRLALPAGLSPERMVRQAMTLVQKTPGLLECDHVSIIAGLIQAAELGLELSGPLGHAYLVPRYDKHARCKKAVFQVGYRGLANLAFRSGQVASMPVRTVYELDELEIQYGTANALFHRPAKGNRGNAVGYYALAVLKTGGHDFEYLTREEAEFHRQKYARDNPIWSSNFDEMASKTAVRKLCDRLPLCPEAQIAASLDRLGEHLLTAPPGPPPASRTEQVEHLLAGPAPEGEDFPEAPEEGGPS